MYTHKGKTTWGHRRWPSASQGERPEEKPTLSTPWFELGFDPASRVLRKIPAAWATRSVVFSYGGPSWPIQRGRVMLPKWSISEDIFNCKNEEVWEHGNWAFSYPVSSWGRGLLNSLWIPNLSTTLGTEHVLNNDQQNEWWNEKEERFKRGL